ncbi:hypothetical protein BDP27DRAFT_1312666 [Rhodocollybia butyracea]|uniref:Uncharacterized protein n=1 Tax=Rhodocollybia butyracea TaxID=206335 RepID=A0A9P5UF26_9AGAR|nr:hypothetical protein BDP27DRAFT_1312666 [Rhodocollybia butyracea]
MPLPPLRQFVFPAFPDYIASSQSIHSVAASPVKHVVDRPPSVYSASSASSDVRSQSSSASSKVYATPPTMKKTHRKQSPLVWFKDASEVTGTGSSSSLSSMQSATSSMSISSLRRPRSGHRNSLQGMKPDPSLSYKRYTARSSSDVRQSKRLVKLSRPPSEDLVSIVRKVFVECGSEVDTEGGGARARLINRETARSFGGMEIVDEEEEEEELFPPPAEKEQGQHAYSSHPNTLRIVDEGNEGGLFYQPHHVEQSSEPHSPSSCSSTPDSTGPLTPILPSSLFGSPKIIMSSCPVRSEPLMVTTQLPYLNRTSVVLSGLGISLPSDGSFPEVQGTANTMDAEKRVSVVTWSDLVSFSSYGLNTTSQSDTDILEEEQASILEEYLDEGEQLTANSLEDSDSGTELAAVLDSMSLLVGRGLDARLLLSPPRQFCYAQAV